MPAPIHLSPAYFSTGQSADSMHSGPKKEHVQGPWARVEWSEWCRAQQDGWGWRSGQAFQETPQGAQRLLWTEADCLSYLPAWIFLLAFPLLCPFRFLIKIYPNWKISSPITAPRTISTLALWTVCPSVRASSGLGHSLLLALLSASCALSP